MSVPIGGTPPPGGGLDHLIGFENLIEVDSQNLDPPSTVDQGVIYEDDHMSNPESDTQRKQSLGSVENEALKSSPVGNSQRNVSYLYSPNHIGPYQVMVEAKNKSNVGNYHHLGIARKILDLKLGALKKLERKGINRICVHFDNYLSANEFVMGNIGGEYNTFIPNNLVSCRGIVRFIDRDIGDEELTKLAVANNVEILNARRLKRRRVLEDGKVTHEFTGTVLFTFSGRILPRFVEIYSVPMQVEPYVIPVLQCFACLLYGHTKNQCRAKKIRCHTCSGTHKIEQECSREVRCLHCRVGDHKSTSRACPEYNRQKQIRELMCCENISFYDANLKLPKAGRQKTFVFDENNFPGLKERKVDSAPSGQHKTNTGTIKRTYASRSQPLPKKAREDLSRSSGYDREAHKACLMTPNLNYRPHVERLRERGKSSMDREQKSVGQLSEEVGASISHFLTSLKQSNPREVNENVARMTKVWKEFLDSVVRLSGLIHGSDSE